MAGELAKRFMEALQEAEESKDVSGLAQLFTDGAELQSPARTREDHGREGAERFWSEYLSVFQNVHSEFTAVTEQDGRAVLEWVSEGALNTGQPVRYGGVSIIEGGDNGIEAFRTYYDSAVFLPNGSKKA